MVPQPVFPYRDGAIWPRFMFDAVGRARRAAKGVIQTMRKRETIEPHPGDKRYIRRDDEGRFTADQVDVNRSLRRDNDQRAKNNTPPGQGDRGDHRRKK